MKVKVTSLTPYTKEGSNIKGFATVNFEDIISVNVRIFANKQDEPFMVFPQKKVAEGEKNKNYVVCDKQTFAEVNQMVKDEYNKVKDMSKEDRANYFKEANADERKPNMELTTVKMYSTENAVTRQENPEDKNRVVGIGSLTIKDNDRNVTMQYLKLYENNAKKLDLSFPQYYTKGEEGKKEYHNCYSITKEAIGNVKEKAIALFEEHLKQRENTESEEKTNTPTPEDDVEEDELPF